MPSYTIESEIFQIFPGFRRGVIVATGINNRADGVEPAHLLADAVSRVSQASTESERARIGVWNEAYAKCGTDPSRFTPSIRFLYEQIRKGRPPRSINKVVDAMNYLSISRVTPCGGDDLDALNGGDMRLGLAHGDETFAPLFKPSAVEHPDAREIIYYVRQSKRVMCRRWTWRNADFSKLSPETRAVVINIDMMTPPFADDDLSSAISDLVGLLQRCVGGVIASHILSASNPTVGIAI